MPNQDVNVNAPSGALVPNDVVLVMVGEEISPKSYPVGELLKTGVLTAEELTSSVVSNEQIVVVQGAGWDFQVVPGRLQLKGGGLTIHQIVNELGKKFYGIAQIRNFEKHLALGINFNFLVTNPDGVTFGKWNRFLFCGEFSKRIASSEDARFGLYYSFRFFGEWCGVSLPV